MRRTATTANAVLGLLALRPAWPAYALTQQLRRTMRFFWPRAESRIYDEARRLVDRGLAAAQALPSGRRRRTVYSVTPSGRHALERWLAQPPRGTALECEPLLRVFLADFCTRAQLRAALDQVKADAEAILEVGRVVGPEYLAGTAPFQDQVHARSLVFDFLWSHATMLRRWAERAEATIDGWDALPADARADAALAVIRGHLANDSARPAVPGGPNRPRRPVPPSRRSNGARGGGRRARPGDG
jgi:DNA-binding PadR family transcriptional regulator